MPSAQRESWLHPLVPVLVLVAAGLLVAHSARPRGDVPSGVAACAAPVRR